MNVKKLSLDLAVIGGGVAGMAAAISASHKGIKDIGIFEINDRLGGVLDVLGELRVRVHTVIDRRRSNVVLGKGLGKDADAMAATALQASAVNIDEKIAGLISGIGEIEVEADPRLVLDINMLDHSVFLHK